MAKTGFHPLGDGEFMRGGEMTAGEIMRKRILRKLTLKPEYVTAKDTNGRFIGSQNSYIINSGEARFIVEILTKIGEIESSKTLEAME